MCKLCLPTEYILNPFLNCKSCPSEGKCMQGILMLRSGKHYEVVCYILYSKDFGEHPETQIYYISVFHTRIVAGILNVHIYKIQ